MHFMVKIGKGGRTADTRSREVESGRCKLTRIPNRIKRKYVNPYILSGSLPGTRWISQSPLWARNLTLFLLCLNLSASKLKLVFIFLLNNEATVRLDDFEIGIPAIARKWYSCAERKKYWTRPTPLSSMLARFLPNGDHTLLAVVSSFSCISGPKR